MQALYGCSVRALLSGARPDDKAEVLASLQVSKGQGVM